MTTPTRKRREPTEEEIKIRRDALKSGIKKDFLTSNVTYVEAKELPFLVGRIRQTAEMRTAVRNELRREFDASIVAVGDSRVAIVKRNPN